MITSKDLSAHNETVYGELPVSNPSYQEPSIFRLPPEILSEILTHAVVGYDSPQGRYISLYQVMGVCSLWKNVAEHTPSLWASVHSDMGLRLLNISLSRSCNHPLTVSWFFGNPWRPKPDADARFPTVAQHMHRWGSAEIFGFPPVKSRDLLVSQAAPQLKSLHLHKSRPNLQPGSGPLDIAVEGTPLLEVLEVSGFPLLWDSSIFKGLRELRINNPSPPIPSTAQLLRILSQTSRLEILSFLSLNHGAVVAAESLFGRISLPRLQTLKLDRVALSFVYTILHRIDAPRITTLCIGIMPPLHGPRLSRRVARECWLLALPYLRNQPGLKPLAVQLGKGMNIDSVLHQTTSGTFRFEQPRGYSHQSHWDDASGGFSVRDLVGELERSWGPESEWKMSRQVMISDPDGVIFEELQRLSPGEAIDFEQVDGSALRDGRD